MLGELEIEKSLIGTGCIRLIDIDALPGRRIVQVEYRGLETGVLVDDRAVIRAKAST